MCLSHLLSPVLMTALGTAQGLLGKYLLNSIPNQTGNPLHPCLGTILGDSAVTKAIIGHILTATVASGCRVRRYLSHFSIVCLPKLSIPGFTPTHSHFLSWKITRKLHGSCQRDSSGIEHMALGSHTNKDVATSSVVASFSPTGWRLPPLPR